jgi:hypothetical protein
MVQIRVITISLFPLCFLSYHCLADSVHSESEFLAFFPLPSLVLKPVHSFFLDSCVHTCSTSLQASYIHTILLNNRAYHFSLLVCLV